VANQSGGLTWNVFLTPERATASDDHPQGVRRTWAPITATLISGKRDAVLVDSLLTSDQALTLASWIAASGKNLTSIYITHGHADHFFGLGLLLDRFPDAKALATPAAIAHMRKQMAPNLVRSYWNALFPDQIPEHLVVPEPLGSEVIDLEGRDLVVVETGHTDTGETTCLHVPAIDLIVAGDAVYNGVHLYLGESDRAGRQEWGAALDVIESLRPQAVIAGHKAPGADDRPRSIDETRQYLRDFDRVESLTTTTQELYEQMLALHPRLVSPGTLWGSVSALRPSHVPNQSD
jgi:glyoxylase-like metal-dependent hydrolase (beta-lactamase superfamily II)